MSKDTQYVGDNREFMQLAMELAAEQMSTALFCINDAVRALEEAQKAFPAPQLNCPSTTSL